jgi:hypothetical protein
MAARSLTSGRGSNQYRTRPRPQLQMPPPVNTGKSLRRCDEIWDDGTAGPCAHLVGPPSWSHHAHPGLGARILAARHTKLPWLRQLLTQDRNPVVRMQISESPDCPARSLGQMAHDTSANVRLTVAANPRCPSSARIQLAHDPDVAVRLRLVRATSRTWPVLQVGNVGIPSDMTPRAQHGTGTNQYQRRGASHLRIDAAPWPDVSLIAQARDAIAQARDSDLDTSDPAYRRLPRDLELEARRGAAANPNSPPDTLERLAADNDSGVRRGVARNPTSPLDIMMRLAQDIDPIVRWGAARNPSSPPGLLGRLAADPDHEVRCYIAGNPNTPPSALEQLARDPNPDVRHALAGNPRCPSRELKKLLRDPDKRVRDQAASNPAPAE